MATASVALVDACATGGAVVDSCATGAAVVDACATGAAVVDACATGAAVVDSVLPNKLPRKAFSVTDMTTASGTGALLVLSASAPAEHCEVSPPPLPPDV
jgi:hypothetical protein